MSCHSVYFFSSSFTSSFLFFLSLLPFLWSVILADLKKGEAGFVLKKINFFVTLFFRQKFLDIFYVFYSFFRQNSDRQNFVYIFLYILYIFGGRVFFVLDEYMNYFLFYLFSFFFKFESQKILKDSKELNSIFFRGCLFIFLRIIL